MVIIICTYFMVDYLCLRLAITFHMFRYIKNGMEDNKTEGKYLIK